MIAFALVVVILALAAQRLFLANTLKKVSYDCRPSRNLVEPGEDFELISEIRNEKRLPELYLELSEDLPGGAVAVSQTGRKFFLLPRRRLTSRTTIHLPARGRYLFHGAILTGGDFFGLRTTRKRFDQLREVVVLPPRAQSPDLQRLLGGFLGDISVSRFILPDPVLAIGVREYTGREPRKDISWAHSARAGRLLVKNYDHTLELAVTVVLNLESSGNTSPEILERCFSLTRSVCEELERRGMKYGFLTNAVAVGALGQGNDLADGLGPSHLSAVLEWLGRSSYSWRGGLADLLDKAARRAERGRAAILITPVFLTGQGRLLDRLRAATGGEVLVIVGEDL